ncbi:hypothetical protein ABW21_db0203678 [Orbilia brochopaga]|nr:hypothetical protein ABW21_db0203678 [Drechslerella brochopaga]
MAAAPNTENASKGNSLIALAASFAERPIGSKPVTRSKSRARYTRRPPRISRPVMADRKLSITTRSIPVSNVSDLPKSRVLPTVRNITIFCSLGTACIIACIALVLLKHVSFWVTVVASICGVLGAVFYIEVALLVSARFRCRILDEECTVLDMGRAKNPRSAKGLSWDLRNLGAGKEPNDDGAQMSEVDKFNEAYTPQAYAPHRMMAANQCERRGSPCLSLVDEGEVGEKDVAIVVCLQRPAPAATCTISRI